MICVAQVLMEAPSSDVTPDLLVAINFTTLGMFDDSLVDARMRTVSILVGLTNNTHDVVANTIPTPIFPGLHLAGNVSRRFKRRFVKPPLASWGIFSVGQKPDSSSLVGEILTNACYLVFNIIPCDGPFPTFSRSFLPCPSKRRHGHIENLWSK